MYKRIIYCLLLACAVCVGCEDMTAYKGYIKINKVNGQVSYIEVQVPTGTYLLRSREEATRYIDQMESVLSDLKQARDQMPVVEKK